MASGSITLPPGASLVSGPGDDSGGMKLPSGATLVSGGAPAPPDQPGFFRRLWEGTGKPIADIVSDNVMNTQEHPVQSALGPVGAAAGVFQKMAAQTQTHSDAATDSWKKGDYGQAVWHLAQAFPLTMGPAAAADSIAQDVKSGNVKGAAGTLAGLLLPVGAAKVAGKIGGAAQAIEGAEAPGALARTTQKVLGATTRAGEGSVAEVMQGNPEAIAAMRGEIPAATIRQNLADAVQEVRDRRGLDYRTRLNQMPSGAGTSLDINPIQQTLQSKLAEFGVKVAPDKTLDFSGSTIGDTAAQGRVTQMYNDVMHWGETAGNRQPLGVDTLKRRIADLYSPTGTERALTQSVKNSAADVLAKGVPGYADMTKNYAHASDFLDRLKDLSLDNSNPGVAIRKLMRNDAYRQTLIDALDQYHVADLKGQIAGLRMGGWTPGSFTAPGGLGGAGLAWALGVKMLGAPLALGVAMSSPRLMGEFLNGLAKMAPAVKAIRGTAATAGAAATGLAASGTPLRTVSMPDLDNVNLGELAP